MKKKIALLMACVMAFGVAVGGTLAWLTDNTAPVVNTFTDSDINITLEETDVEANQTPNANAYQMIPGYTISKDPKVTVKANSESCYVFVKIDKSANYDTYLEQYVVDTAWTQLKDDKGTANEADDTNVEGVFYQRVAKQSTDWSDYVLKGKEGFANGYVTVQTTVTKAQMDAIDEPATESQPTLTFTAYASQLMKNNTEEFSAYQAWVNAQPVTP